MAVLNREAFMSMIHRRIGDGASDDDLRDLEDVEDTLNHYEANAGEDWKQKYNDLDESWRKRYRDRFFSGKEADEMEVIPRTDETPAPEEQITIDDLFS